MRLSYDLFAVIFDRCDFESQIRYRQCNKFTYNNIQMTQFFTIRKISLKLSNDILKMYPYVVELDAFNTNKITDINHLYYLKVLDASCSLIKQYGISELRNIETLITNPNISDVNHLTRLKYLRDYGSNLSQDGISECREIETLIISQHTRIIDVNHLKKLKYLDISYSTVTQTGINELRELVCLYMGNNGRITDVNHVTKLQILDAPYAYGLTQDSIRDLRELIELNVYNTNSITDVNHLTKLKKISAGKHYYPGLDQYCIDQYGISRNKNNI